MYINGGREEGMDGIEREVFDGSRGYGVSLDGELGEGGPEDGDVWGTEGGYATWRVL